MNKKYDPYYGSIFNNVSIDQQEWNYNLSFFGKHITWVFLHNLLTNSSFSRYKVKDIDDIRITQKNYLSHIFLHRHLGYLYFITHWICFDYLLLISFRYLHEILLIKNLLSLKDKMLIAYCLQENFEKFEWNQNVNISLNDLF